MTDRALAPETVRRICDPSSFDFETTETLDPLDERLGQERAKKAIELALAIRTDGYNVFAMGPTRAGKRHAVSAMIEAEAAKMPVAEDVCYVNRFDKPREPRVLRMPAGRAKLLREALAHLVDDLRVAIPQVIEGDEFRKRREAIESEVKEKNEAEFNGIRERAEAQHVGIVGTPQGFSLAPVANGELLSEEQFNALPEPVRKSFTEAAQQTEKAMRAFLSEVPRREKDARRRIKAAANELVAGVVAHLVEDVREDFQDIPAVIEHLKALEKHVAENPSDWIETSGGPSIMTGALEAGAIKENPLLRRYGVHVLVDRSGEKGAPVVYEAHPTYENLIGSMDHVPVLGALLTDIHLIKAGALHKANGGYLLVDARALLMQPYAWEALKRAMKTRTVMIEPLARMLGVLGGVALAPEPISLDVKIVLIGERQLFYLLSEYDPDFPGLFRIVADFEDHIDRNHENEVLLARFLAKIGKECSLLAIDRTGVARMVEHASRLAEDSEKLTVHADDLRGVLREADLYARRAGAKTIGLEHVKAAVDAADDRMARVRETIQEEIEKGTLLVTTTGKRVGQINGLTVAKLGDHSFGWPTRITATARMGDGRVIDIEKEVELGGPIHSKGVLILSGFLSGRYSPTTPLSLRASIVLEQSYGRVEGDSASLAELCALLSAIAELPIEQCFAMTGSVNQHGDVQPIGGVNDKIEGYFDVCKTRGLTGQEGVLIPSTNVKNLALRDDIVAAVREGRFRVIPITRVDDAIEVLFGMPAGERGPDGRFAEGSLNRAVEDRLVGFHEKRLEAARESARAERGEK